MPQSYDFTVGDLIALIKGSFPLLSTPHFPLLFFITTIILTFTSSSTDIAPSSAEHASLTFPNYTQAALRVVSWHTDTGKVQAAVIANRVGTVPASAGQGANASQKVQNKVLYRCEVQGQTADALRQLLKGLEGMSRSKFGNAGAGQVV